jgi:hypothetical protein
MPSAQGGSTVKSAFDEQLSPRRERGTQVLVPGSHQRCMAHCPVAQEAPSSSTCSHRPVEREQKRSSVLKQRALGSERLANEQLLCA